MFHAKYSICSPLEKPRTMTNVEEHIKNSLLNEVTSSNSSFKNIKIDPESIEVKRSLDVEALKSSSFVKEIDVSTVQFCIFNNCTCRQMH